MAVAVEQDLLIHLLERKVEPAPQEFAYQARFYGDGEWGGFIGNVLLYRVIEVDFPDKRGACVGIENKVSF